MSSSAKITPFLMFIGKAEAAMTFYTSLFSGSEILDITHYGAGEMGAEGSVKLARMKLANQEVICIDSPPVHDFDFTPSFSLFVELESEAEIDRVYAALSEGGKDLMPLGEYPFATKYAWLNDRFGVSWQLSYKA